MNKSIFIILALFLSGFATQKHELGLFIGTSGYHGDIGDNKVGNIQTPKPLFWTYSQNKPS